MLQSRLEFPFVAACLCYTQCGSCQGPVNYLFKHSFALTKKKGGVGAAQRGGRVSWFHTMNKLIKRFSPLLPWNHPFQKKSQKTESVRLQKYNTKKRRRAGWREEGKNQMSSWNDCASSSPLAYPKIPDAGNVKARRTTDAVPQRGSAGIISEGSGGLKWRTNFSKTSSERNVHALRFFSSPSPLSPLFSHSPPFSFFFLCVVFQTRTPLFCQINISQNKSQDNFKLASEERGRRRGRHRGRIWFSLHAPCDVESPSSRSSHFEVCGFVDAVLESAPSNWWGRHNCLWMANEGNVFWSRKGHFHIVGTMSRNPRTMGVYSFLYR